MSGPYLLCTYFSSSLSVSFPFSVFLLWGTDDANSFSLSSGSLRLAKVSSLQPGVGQNIAQHVWPTARNSVLISDLPGSSKFTFPQSSSILNWHDMCHRYGTMNSPFDIFDFRDFFPGCVRLDTDLLIHSVFALIINQTAGRALKSKYLHRSVCPCIDLYVPAYIYLSLSYWSLASHVCWLYFGSVFIWKKKKKTHAKLRQDQLVEEPRE